MEDEVKVQVLRCTRRISALDWRICRYVTVANAGISMIGVFCRTGSRRRRTRVEVLALGNAYSAT